MMDAFDEAPQKPRKLDRRGFVKIALVAGTAGAAAATGAAVIGSVIKSEKPPPKFDYVGVKVLPTSKAPRGIPLIPTTVNAAGEIVGKPEHLEWYAYCGRKNAPGLAPDAVTDNVFRYGIDDQNRDLARAAGTPLWFEEKLGQKVLAADFAQANQGAHALWRSEGNELTNPLTALVIKVDTAAYPAELVERFFPQGFLAIFATCAHFCCVPTWKISSLGYGRGHEDDITCFCHGSWYSVKELVTYPFPPTA